MSGINPEDTFERLKLGEAEWVRKGDTLADYESLETQSGEVFLRIKPNTVREDLDLMGIEETADAVLVELVDAGPNRHLIPELVREFEAERLDGVVSEEWERLRAELLEIALHLNTLTEEAKRNFYMTMKYVGPITPNPSYVDESHILHYGTRGMSGGVGVLNVAGLEGFALTDDDGRRPVHIEPVVRSFRDPRKIGFFPIGSTFEAWPLVFPEKSRDELADLLREQKDS